MDKRLKRAGGDPLRIAVLGGGISGLAAAYALARARSSGTPIDEFLLEATDRLGGVVRTENSQGFVIEAGPDSFLTEKPEAAALCRELGLGDSLIGSNDHGRRTYILHQKRLVPLPDGMMLLVPGRVWPIVATPLLPLRSKLAIAAEWFKGSDARGPFADESVASFVRRHFGSAMLEYIAEPLLTGIFGGDPERLSARATLPSFWELEKQYGSLIRGIHELRKRRRVIMRFQPENSRTLFTTLREGLGGLVAELRKRLDPSRVLIRQRAIAVERGGFRPAGAGPPLAGPYKILLEGGPTRDADALVVALPAHECARLLNSLDSDLADSLKAIPYNSAVTVTLAFEASTCAQLPPGFGFVVPRKEGRKLLATTFMHNKFPCRAPAGKALLRCFLGGSRCPDVSGLVDDEILSLVRQELREILDLRAEPMFYRVFRWSSSMPQYAVGHLQLLEKIKARLEKNPGLYLAGNAYSGVGISDCIRTGKTAAEQALELLRR